MDVLTDIRNRHWSRQYRRYFNIHKLDLYLQHMQQELEKFVGYGMDSLLALGEGYDVRWYFDEDQFSRLARAVADTTWHDAKRNTNHIRAMKQYATEGVALIDTFDTIDLTSYTSQQLAEAYQAFLVAADHIIPILYTGVVTDRELFDQAREVLQKQYEKEQLEKTFEMVITPVYPTPISQEELDLCALRIADEDEKTLRLHQQRYRWVGMRFVEQQPRGIDDIRQAAQSIDAKSAQQRIDTATSKSHGRKKALDAVLQQFEKVEARFLSLVNAYSTLRHERDVYRGSLYYYGHYLYAAIAAHARVSLDTLLSYTISEVITLLTKGRTVPDNEINKRKTRFGYVLLANDTSIVTDWAPLDKIESIVAAPISHAGTLRGTPAQYGTAKGVVRLIRSGHAPHDVAQVQKNEILVAYSTKPEYVPAMKKAAAILTEEGGLTCHAAIVSRELGVPCIVGVEGLTDSLQTGDMVRVDAKEGIIKKL